MTTYYVAKSGNDSNAGTSEAAPKLTIQAALNVATTTADVVEIIDESRYNEGYLAQSADRITIQHTASELGRPTIYGTGAAGSGPVSAFNVAYQQCIYIGLEIAEYTTSVFNDGGSGYDKFIMSGCFVHDVPKLGNSIIASGDSSSPVAIKQCVMFFQPGTSTPILNNGYMEISNCLITSSNTSGDWPLIYDYGVNGTASFSTIINRGTTSKSTIRFPKVINCILTTEGGNGIASDDQTYNIVRTSGHAFRDFADSSNAATASGELVATMEEIAFVDKDSVGSTISISANYNLQGTSVALDAGVAYDSIAVDITGTIRPQGGSFDIGAFEYISSDPEWTEPIAQPRDNRNSDFTLNTYRNLASNHKFKYTSDPGQAPFSVGIKGPSTLRGRSKPYKTTK
jgi:hypothetical protein